MTEFETLLKTHFPEIYALHELSKTDRYLWLAVNSLIKMGTDKTSGIVEVKFSDGVIDRVISSEYLTTRRSRLPFKPDTLE